VDFVDLRVWGLFCRGRHQRLFDGERDSRLVQFLGQAHDCPAQLALRTSLDVALRADVLGRVAGMGGLAVAIAHCGIDAVSGATWAELHLVADLLPLPRHRGRVCGSSLTLGCHWCYDARLQSRGAYCSMDDGALLGLGQLCFNTELGILACERSLMFTPPLFPRGIPSRY